MTPKSWTIKFVLKITLISFHFGCSTLFAQTKATTSPNRSTPLPANDPATEAIQKTITLMEQEQWQKALDLVNQIITTHQDEGVKKYGAKFGTSYYYKGLCLLKLAQASKGDASVNLFKSSILSFDQCFAINPPNDSTNLYRAKALLLRGNAQQALHQYQPAIDSYEQFLHERNVVRDVYSLSEFNINFAICMWKNATANITDFSAPEQKIKQHQEIRNAVSLIQQSLLHSGRNAPNPKALITAFKALSLISTQLKDDAIIPTTIQKIQDTITENLHITRDTAAENKREDFQIKLSQNLTNLTNLSNLITNTSLKNLPRTSLALTTIFPGIQQYSTELNINSTLLSERSGNTKSYLQSETLPEKEARKLKKAIFNVLKARAQVLQKTENPSDIRSAVSLYKIIVDDFTESSDPEKDLYNLIRVAARSEHPSDSNLALTRAKLFLNKYTESNLYEPTRILYLITLYQDQQYRKALELAEQIIVENKHRSNNTDFNNPNILQNASFIQAASNYYLGEYTTADALLTKHAQKYPTNNPANIYSSDVAYLSAAIQNQLLNWDSSIPLLKAFIKQHIEQDHPTSAYTPYAYYDIAYALYSQEKSHSAILALQPFALEQTINLPTIAPENKAFDSVHLRRSKVAPSAAILLGNIRLTLGDHTNAVKHYANAIELAKQNGNINARDEAYYHIIKTLGSRLWSGILNERLPETLTYYEEFINLPGATSSPYYTQILTSAITALEKSDPEESVQLTLQNNLFLHNSIPNTPGIEACLKIYLFYLRKNNNNTSEAINILNDEVPSTNSAYHQALLIVAKLEILEFQKKRVLGAGEIDEQTLGELNVQIDQYYEDLISSYRTEDLDNFTLLKIAQYLNSTDNKNKPYEATEYFQAIIDHPSTIKQTEALLGIAIHKSHSQNSESRIQAKQELKNIIESPFTPLASKATAHYNLIKLLLNNPQPEWNNIEKYSISYLKYPLKVKDNNIQILETLALTYDKQNKVNDAIASYTQIWASSLFSIQHSAPAIQRVCELLWERNNSAKPNINEGKSDRQLAYETAYKYIRKTKDHFGNRKPALSKESIATWQQVQNLATKTYPKDSKVKAFPGQP